jgi:hypothetical protein
MWPGHDFLRAQPALPRLVVEERGQLPTDTHTERCDSCGLWYEGLHPARDGRYLCRLCLELEGQNEWGGSPLLGG